MEENFLLNSEKLIQSIPAERLNKNTDFKDIIETCLDISLEVYIRLCDEYDMELEISNITENSFCIYDIVLNRYKIFHLIGTHKYNELKDKTTEEKRSEIDAQINRKQYILRKGKKYLCIPFSNRNQSQFHDILILKNLDKIPKECKTIV